MSVLSRKVNEKLLIGDDLVIAISEIHGSRVTVAVDAPREISIKLAELTARPKPDSDHRGPANAAPLHMAKRCA